MTREYDELPDVDETVLPRSLRVSIFVAGALKGSLCGALACAFVLVAFPPLIEAFSRTAISVVADGAPQAEGPSAVQAFAFWLGALGTGVFVAAGVSGRSILRQIDAAKYRIHTTVYRDVIWEHIRDEAERRRLER